VFVSPAFAITHQSHRNAELSFGITGTTLATPDEATTQPALDPQQSTGEFSPVKRKTKAATSCGFFYITIVFAEPFC